jgi:uncharacterized protein (TIGR00730 family)
MRRVCVYCGASPGRRPSYLREARRLGGLLAERGIGLVYGGASVGLMGALADAALAGGGEVLGVIPRNLEEREIGHRRLTKLHVVGSMHERKQKMSDLADAFLALPGGVGTLEELSETLTWSMLGLHAKPLGLLDVDGYWRPLLEFLDHAVAEGFLRAEHRALVLDDASATSLLDRLAAWRPPAPTVKWITREET